MKININDIVNYNNSGFTFSEISEKYNCSVSTIQRILKKNNISLRKKSINKEELIILYKNKTKIKDIAKHFNCSISTIRYRLKKYNIKLNNKKWKSPIIGDKFNKLTFIKEYYNEKYNKKYMICECVCGNIKSYDYHHILTGNVKSCGCYHKNNVKEYNWSGYKDIPGTYWGSIISGAKNRNKQFSISIEYAWEIYIKQNKKCKLTNLPIEFKTKNKPIKTNNASLDRINNKKGYIKGNVQWVTKEINIMKNILDEKEFIKLCEQVTLKNKSKV